MAAAVFVLQVAVLWTSSPDPGLVVPGRVPPRQRMVTEASDAAGARLLDAWRWLFTPALLVLPSAEDYSGPAWMRGTAVRIEVEAFDVPERPLPWLGDRPGVLLAESAGRMDPGPLVRWEVRWDAVPVPAVSPVRMPEGARVRMLGGLAGRAPVGVTEWGGGPAAGLEVARPVVVRVWVDFQGELVRPPVVWESSGSSSVDEAALKAARRMRFTPAGQDGAVDWGLVGFESGVSPAPGGGVGVAVGNGGGA